MIRLVPLFELTAEVDEIIDFQPGPAGHLRVVPIRGGSFRGERVSGTLLPLGADWQTMRDGAAELDIRCLMRSDAGAMIHLRGQGLRHGPPEVLARLARGEPVDPSEYYFREVMRFQTSAPDLLWLNNLFALATGRREARRVVLDVFEVA